MNRAILSQRISSILDDIQRLNNALYAMNTTDIQRYPDNYEVLSTDAALRAEQTTCRLRHLIYATTRISIMDSGLFPEWLEKRWAAPQSIKDLVG